MYHIARVMRVDDDSNNVQYICHNICIANHDLCNKPVYRTGIRCNRGPHCGNHRYLVPTEEMNVMVVGMYMKIQLKIYESMKGSACRQIERQIRSLISLVVVVEKKE